MKVARRSRRFASVDDYIGSLIRAEKSGAMSSDDVSDALLAVVGVASKESRKPVAMAVAATSPKRNRSVRLAHQKRADIEAREVELSDVASGDDPERALAAREGLKAVLNILTPDQRSAIVDWLGATHGDRQQSSTQRSHVRRGLEKIHATFEFSDFL